MWRTDALLITLSERADLNPLIPSPVEVIAALVIGSLLFVALVAAGVFLGIRIASRRSNATARPES